MALTLGIVLPHPTGHDATGALIGWETHGPPGLIRELTVDPFDPRTLYAGGSLGIYKSTDGGRRWRAASAGLPPNTIAEAILVDPVDRGTVYVAAESGVYKSTNGGESWTARNEGLVNLPETLVMDPFDPQTLYVGGRGDEGQVLLKSTDGAAT